MRSLLHRGRNLFDRSEEKIDAALSILLAVQALTVFVVIPWGATHAGGVTAREIRNIC